MGFGAGGERLLAQLANRLSNDGFDIGIYSIPFGKRDKMPMLDDKVEYHEKWFHNIDADLANFIYAPLVKNLFKFKNNIPKIASIHGYPLVPELQHESIRDISFLERFKKTGFIRSGVWFHARHFRNFDGYDAIHVINPAMVNIFKEYKKVYSISNWVDTKLFSPNGEKLEKFTVLFAGRDDWVKGVDIYEEIFRTAKKMNLDNKIEFLCTVDRDICSRRLGFLNDKALIYMYSRAHVLVYPTRIDTFGNVITESLSCQTPVISSGLPVHVGMDLPLLYANGSCEFLEKIIYLKNLWENDTKEYERLCKFGRQQVVERYDFDRIYPKFIDMFQEVSSRK